ncbi:MAG: hypothetical protein LBU62_00175 [Bacteroidales bacterium]|jgi:hypothetical protein|nr:hypothetical protein [Bacteroidales bacterium]
MRRFLVSLFIVCSVASAHAQSIQELLKQLETDTLAEQVVLDTMWLQNETLSVAAVPCNPDVLQKFQKDDLYAYDKDRMTWAQRMQLFINKWLYRFIGKSISSVTIRTAFWMTGIAVAILFLILILKKNTNVFYWAGRKRLSYNIEDEDIENQDYDLLLEKAVKSGQYENAIRWQFMKTLQILQKHRLISFDSYKTVNEYVYEITESGLRMKFKTLSYSFVYYRYGQGEANGIRFAEFHNASEELIKMIGK